MNEDTPMNFSTFAILVTLLFLVLMFLLSCSPVDSDWSELIRRAEGARIQEYESANEGDKTLNLKFWKVDF